MGSGRILVVDDEAPIRDIIRRYLTADGFEVTEAAGGEEALARFAEREPDLVVLDVMMPGVDGLEVLRARSGVYVILLTARAEEVDKLVGLSVGADDYVTKPFSPRELVARVRAVLRRSRDRERRGAAPAGEVLRFAGLEIDAVCRLLRTRLHDVRVVEPIPHGVSCRDLITEDGGNAMRAIETTVSLSPADAEAAVRDALAAQGFGVLTEIDVAATLKAKLDVDRPPMKILGACNPNLANRALEIDPSVSLLLPCNVVVESTADGTKVSAVDPHELMDDPRFAELADDAAHRLRAAIAAVPTA